jgi:hypothetical protein
MRSASLLLCSVLALGACGNAPSKSDCEKLLDHLIDIEMKAGGTGEVSEDMKKDLEKQRAAVREFAAGQKFIETCTEKTPKKVVECGLSAKTADDVAKCDDGK